MNTKVVTLAPTASAEAEARRWIARIDAGPLTSEERVRLQAWLAEDARHVRLLDRHALLWSAAAKAAFAPGVHAVAAPGRRRRPSQAARWLTPALAGCAGVVVAAGLWLGMPSTDVQESAAPQVVSTKVGEHRPVNLEDGSRMHLNTGSKVQVVFTRERRRILLDAGEGYFDVVKDASRPFEVVVGSTLVRAVGTRFLVRRQANGQAGVTVFEGVVELVRVSAHASPPEPGGARPAQLPVRLVVGQSASEQEQLVVLRSLNAPALEHMLAWQQDRIVFDNTPLAAAIEQVNRYSTVPLTFDDESLHDLRVSGAFSTRDIPVFLRSLEQGFGLRVERRAQSVQISRGGSR